MPKEKRLTTAQSTLLRLADASPGKIFYPRPQIWLEGKFILISGGGVCSSIASLWKQGLIKMVPHLHEYAFENTHEGNALLEGERGKPMAWVSPL